MKKISLTISILIIAFSSIAKIPSIALLKIETLNTPLTNQEIRSLVQLELEKTELFDVYNLQDLDAELIKNELSSNFCYDKSCLLEKGKILKVNFILSGQIEKIQDKIIFKFRLVNIDSAEISKSSLDIYDLSYSHFNLQLMLTMKKFLNQPYDLTLYNELKSVDDFDAMRKKSYAYPTKLEGPRTGLAYIDGNIGKRILAPKEQGGLYSIPLFTVFAYQKEIQYFSKSSMQSLFQFNFSIAGLEKGIFSPGLTIINGYRFSKIGIEIGFGPSIGILPQAEGYYDDEGTWNLKKDWKLKDSQGNPVANPYKIKREFDTRGTYELNAGLMLAAGYCIRAGSLNIPLNAYFVPSLNGNRYGFSVGFVKGSN